MFEESSGTQLPWKIQKDFDMAIDLLIINISCPCELIKIRAYQEKVCPALLVTVSFFSTLLAVLLLNPASYNLPVHVPLGVVFTVLLMCMK